MNRVLITGVAGLLGSRLADWLIENKEDVLVCGIDDLSGGYAENVHPQVLFYQMNSILDLNVQVIIIKAELHLMINGFEAIQHYLAV